MVHKLTIKSMQNYTELQSYNYHLANYHNNFHCIAIYHIVENIGEFSYLDYLEEKSFPLHGM